MSSRLHGYTPKPDPTANGDGGPSEEIRYRRLEAMIENAASLSRLDRMSRLLDPRVDLYEECGWPKMPSATDYQDLYDREPVAARVVELYPKECWQVTPMVYESEDSETITPFEEGWDDLAKQLRGEQSYFKDVEGSPVWEYLLRADILSGIGQYGVIFLGLDDGLDPSIPVEGIEEKFSKSSEPKNPDSPDNQGKFGNPTQNPKAPAPDTEEDMPRRLPVSNVKSSKERYELVVNEEMTKGRKLKFLRVFPEALAQVVQFEQNTTSPRYGQPTMYLISLNDPTERTGGGYGAPSAARNVHWTRVVHISDVGHQANSSEVFSPERLRPVLNNVMACQKTDGASQQGYWGAAVPIMSWETHPSMGGDVKFNKAKLKDMWENIKNGLDRASMTTGMSLKTVGPTPVDPTPYGEYHINKICMKLGCPVRIFKGSERGELASTTDDAAWNDRLKQRQNGYITPRVIVPFVDRLIMVGVLPAPGGTPKPRPVNVSRNWARVAGGPVTEPKATPPAGATPPGGKAGPPKPGSPPKPPTANEVMEILGLLTANSNPEGCNQYTGPGCGIAGDTKTWSVGDTLIYRGPGAVDGAEPTEFRGLHSDPMGDRMARVIFRPPNSSPFETSVKPAHLSKGTAPAPEVEDTMTSPATRTATPKPKSGGPPKSLPADGTQVEYLGWKLSRYEGTQMGHKTEGGGLKSQLGIGTSRKVKGVSSVDPDGYERVHDSLKIAIKKIHDYHGLTENALLGKPPSADPAVQKAGQTQAAKGGAGTVAGDPSTATSDPTKPTPADPSSPTFPQEEAAPPMPTVDEGPPGYCIEWPDITSQSDAEKADNANKVITALSAYIAGGCEALVPPQDALVMIFGWDKEEAAAVLENAKRLLEEKQAEELAQQQEMIEAGLAPDPTDPEVIAAQKGVPPGGGPPDSGGGGEPTSNPFAPPTKSAPKPKTPVGNYDPNQPRDKDGRWASVNTGYKRPESAPSWHLPEDYEPHPLNVPNKKLPDSARPTVSREEWGAIDKYTGDYSPVNDPLRVGKLPTGEFADVHNVLQGVFNRLKPLDKPVGVIRGLHIPDKTQLRSFLASALESSKSGNEVTMGGYVSTSTDKAESFPGNIQMKIKAVKGLDVRPQSMNPDENELLLNHNSKFKVLRVTKGRDSDGLKQWTVHMEQIL